MARSFELGFCNCSVPRLLILLGILVCCIVGPALFWHLKEISTPPASCSSCACDCSSESIPSIAFELINSSYADCRTQDPDVMEEMKKGPRDRLSEELDLLRNVSNESLEHSKTLTMDAKQSSSHYQKEAEKCNAGVETCEEARQSAEAELIAECKSTELWKQRAIELGWTRTSRIHSRTQVI